MNEPIPDGIYFGLSEEDYHADDALGSTSLKALVINPVAYWANTKAGNDVLTALGFGREENDEETLAKQFGKACHKIVLEPASFDDVYVEIEDPPPEYLGTKAAIREALEQTPGAYVPIKSALRPEYVMAAKRARLKVIEDWKVDETIRHGGRQALSKRCMATLRFINHLMDTLRSDLQGASVRSDSLTNGYAEVSVFFTDEATGVRCKARFDYLRVKGIVDLKTFMARPDKDTIGAFLLSVQRYGYDLQAAAYLRAWRAMAALIAAGKVYGDHDPAFVSRLRVDKDPLWRWVTVQTAGMIEIDTLDMNAGLALGAAEAQVRQALNSYAEYRDRYGLSAPWVAQRGRIPITDLTLDAAGVAKRMMSRGEIVYETLG